MSGTSEPDSSDFDDFGDAQSICPYCGVGCGIEHAGGGRGKGWKGPVNTRGEICPKGAAAFEHADAEDRLTQPLVRENGHLVTASWEEAYDRIVDGFAEIVEEHGPRALGFFASSNCTNEENYVLQKLARVLGTNSVDNCARLCHSSTVAAMSARLGAGAMTNSLEDLKEADTILITGADPASQHPVAFRSYILPAVKDGATLIHVDPRETNTTDAADIHIPVRPGHDIPVLNALAKAVVEEGLEDEAFLAERTEGIEEFRDHLDGIDVEEQADLAGVDPETIREAARAYGEAERATAFTGMGMSQHHYGTRNVHALINLVLLTGNIGRRGTGVNPLRGQNNVQGAGDVGALPWTLPGYESVEDDDARAALGEVWGVEPPAERGITESEMAQLFGEEIHGLYVFGENPAVGEPATNEVERDFEKLDFVVVQDLYETETAAFADVVLPGSSWAEKDGTVTNTDRQVMRMRETRAPPGDTRHDLDILTTVGERLVDRIGPWQEPRGGSASGDSSGGDSSDGDSSDSDFAPFDFDTPAEVFAELTEASPIYAGMDYDEIGHGSLRWPFPEGADEGTAVLHTETYATGERTTPFVAVEHVPPADDVGEDELVLTTGRTIQHFNTGSLSRRSDTLTRMYPEDKLQINPADAEQRGIEDGDTVRVANDRGEVTAPVDVTTAIRPGSVFLTFHFEEPRVNRLTGEILDPESKIPEYKHSAVTVEPDQ
jgi:formate dehydrogenase major subunit